MSCGLIDDKSTLDQVVGGNDCNEASRGAGDVQDILETYAALITAAKEKSEAITVSSICPRLTSPKTQESIEVLNAGLQELAANNGCKFVDNRATIILHDGTINDGYLLSDGVRLKRQGTNGLAKNLSLVSKDNTNDITKTSRKPPSKQAHRNPQQSPGNHQRGHKPAAPPHHPAAGAATYRPPPRSGDRRFRWSAPPPNGRRTGTDGYASYFCGKTNHNQDTCQWGSPMTCFCCQQKGHEGKFGPQPAQRPPIA